MNRSAPALGLGPVAREAMSFWQTASNAWVSYFAALAGAQTAEALMAANSQLVVDSVSLCENATAATLRNAGVRNPLLNDA
jgi:hypothetical protein